MTGPSTGPSNFGLGNTGRIMDGLRTANENFGPNPFVGNALPIPEEGEQFQARDMLPELKNPFTQVKEAFGTAQEGIKDIAEGKNPFTSGREPEAGAEVDSGPQVNADGAPVVGDGSSAEQFLADKQAHQLGGESVFDKVKRGENPFAQKDVPDNPFEKPESVKQRELDETIKDHKDINPFASRGGDVPENPFEKPGAESELPDDVTYYGKPMPDGAEMEQGVGVYDPDAPNPFEKAVGEQEAAGLATEGPAVEQKPVFERMEIGDTAKESEQEMGE